MPEVHMPVSYTHLDVYKRQQKLHARGPMGLEALTSYKYIIYGSGQIRE